MSDLPTPPQGDTRPGNLATPPTLETRETACTLDCPDSCSIHAEVRDGRLERLDAGPHNPFTQGFLCSKVRRYGRLLEGEDRLLQPGVRAGAKGEGRFEAIGWDEALDLIAERLREVARHDGEGILPLSYGGSNGPMSQDTLDARLFRRLGASRLLRTVCAAPSSAAHQGLYRDMPGMALEDYEHSRLIVVWGANPSASGIHHVPVLKRARERGAILVVVDPRRTKTAKQADLHLAPRPGTDLALALALLRWLFENDGADFEFLEQHARHHEELRSRAAPWTVERAARTCDLEPRAIEELARLWAERSPAAVRCGWGVERNRNGGSAVAAILALPAVAGKFGVRGGGFTMSNGGAWRLGDAACEPVPQTRAINMNRVGRELLEADPPIELVFVYNHNPIATLPRQELVRQGFERDDLFTVVLDPVLTDTARYADLVLPATTFLEHHDLAKGYGAMRIQRVRPVVGPLGEARSNLEVFDALCERLGLHRDGEPRTAGEVERALLGPELSERLDREGSLEPPDAGARPIQFVDARPGGDGRVDLVPAVLDRAAPEGLYAFRDEPGSPDFPLALISPATSSRISSSFGQLDRASVPIEMHPCDATERGLADGQLVRVFNDLGEVHSPLRISGDLRRGTVVMPKGLWSHNSLNGATSNALSPDHLADLGGGACFNDARVEVEALSPA